MSPAAAAAPRVRYVKAPPRARSTAPRDRPQLASFLAKAVVDPKMTSKEWLERLPHIPVDVLDELLAGIAKAPKDPWWES